MKNSKEILLLISAIISTSILLISCSHVTATGEKTGTIVKLSKEGFFIKTYEAEMIKGGMNGGSGSFGVQPFNFTILNQSLLPIVQESFDKQKEITVKYHQEFSCVTDSSSHNIQGDSEDDCYYLDSAKD